MAVQYQLIVGNQMVKRTDDDGAVTHFPRIAGNADYARYLAAGGDGVALPADPLPLVFDASRGINTRVRTTSAIPVEVYRATLATNTLYDANLRLRAVDAGNGVSRRIHAEIMAKRLGAGALLVGSPVVVADQGDAASASWAITATVSGNDFFITCTGAAGRTIDWLLAGVVETFTPGGA